MPIPASTEKSLTKLVQSIRELWQGRSNAAGVVTLAVSPASSTIVHAPNCGKTTTPMLAPLTAHAATAVATTYVLQTDIQLGQFTITHAASAQTDRTFAYALQG